MTQSTSQLAEGEILASVYDELRKLAARKMASEPSNHTLQATALVHEAWLRLGGAENKAWQSRAHFFAAAAEAMRRILIDLARRKAQIKHGGGQERVAVEDVEIAAGEDREVLLQVHEVLDQLAAADPAKAEIVKLRFFVGLSNREIADLLDISERTVERSWSFAKAWLFAAIQNRREHGDVS